MTPDGAGGGPRGPAFGARLAVAMDELGPLCVGIDPHPGLLHAWGLPDDVTGLRELALRTADALTGHVAALKPQAAFFERHGAPGIEVLAELLAHVRSAGTATQVVLDAKRGDIGSSMQGYADAYLRPGAPLACDALTVTPYLGFGSLAPAVEAAAEAGAGLFVLALTSNPEGSAVQHAVGPDGAVAVTVAREAARLNAAELAGSGGRGLGSVGLVVGATVGEAPAHLGLDLAAVRGPLLAPGYGAQGARGDDVARVFAAARDQVLVSSSRGVLGAGPDGGALLAAAREASADVTRALRAAR
ncbi:orotidine-5'-phosphate decarboxylase [Cellulomonas sp. APG4]|uniref:orotidine-5'-phosphate decarboxylase n=1 Tax=Cellulomonas sp. APG4 TaxID=1538656 RepID=UPI00137A6114|nr:orotidine-5'-phosphate decarboxylase [Cellulomonas sp. APG4]NCT90845.1 orotidine-5'-phosphate decarboxylase [Cellulomonas sp. APG4]